MAVTIKKVTLWRAEVENQPGVLSGVLGPLAAAGANLQVVMGYRYRGQENKAAIELGPVSGKKVANAAAQAGFSALPLPTLLVQGDDQPGLGHAIAHALGNAGINVAFLVAQVVEGQFSAIIAFESDDAAKQATALIKKTVVAAGKNGGAQCKICGAAIAGKKAKGK
jgi:hypothetical protein